MPVLQDHLRLALLIQGVFQVKPSSIECEWDSGAQRVDTLEGLAGKTPGSGNFTINATGAVPTSGPEYDYFTACQDGRYVDMQVPFGTKSYIGNGWFQTAGIGQSVGQNTEFKFQWVGEFAKLK